MMLGRIFVWVKAYKNIHFIKDYATAMKHTFSSITLLIISTILFTSCHPSNNKNKDNTSQKTTKNEVIDTFFLKIKGKNASIIPGESIGVIQVGKRTQEINKLNLGQPAKSDAGMCKSLNQWTYGTDSTHFKNLTIFSECSGKDSMRPHIQWVRTNDPKFRTKNNLQTGSSLKAIKSIYDTLALVATYHLKDSSLVNILSAPKKGITFEINTDDNRLSSKDSCLALIIHPETQQIPRYYFSFYNDLKLKAQPEIVIPTKN